MVCHSFLLNMMSFPDMIRNVAVVGHLHHGKTALMDMLVFETHKFVWDSDKPVRFVRSPVTREFNDFAALCRYDTLIHTHYHAREKSL